MVAGAAEKMLSKKEEKLCALVMAGGRGERFWPLSRNAYPKPFVHFTDNSSLIEKTIKRLETFIPLQNIFVATNQNYVKLLKKTLNNFPKENIISEPCVRDTAPCICLAAAIISQRVSENPVMIVLPADHLINDVKSFSTTIKDSAKIAKSTNSVVTIGIKPDYPSTAYGYIESGKSIKSQSKIPFREGLSFVEKPDVDKAKKLLKKGNFLWNAGIFIWEINTFAKLLQKYNPKLHKYFEIFKTADTSKKLQKSIKENFPKIEKISIDFALMEKLEQFIVAEANFDWDDVGAWDSIAKYFQKDNHNNNILTPYFSSLNSENNIVADYSGRKHLIALLDIDNLIVINHKDATLICKKSSAQKLKSLIQKINENPKLKSFL